MSIKDEWGFWVNSFVVLTSNWSENMAAFGLSFLKYLKKKKKEKISIRKQRSVKKTTMNKIHFLKQIKKLKINKCKQNKTVLAHTTTSAANTLHFIVIN